MMDFNLQENHAMNQNELLIGVDRIKRNLLWFE